MAGYSGTPLAKKLGIKAGSRIALPGMPKNITAALSSAIADCSFARRAPLDFVLLFVDSKARLAKAFPRWADMLSSTGMLWVAWPKKSSDVASDLDGNIVRRMGLAGGLVDVKVCAIDESWSALKFVIRVKDRHGR